MGFEPGTFGIQAQSSTTELQGNHKKIAEILDCNHKVTFGPPDFPIRVSYFIYHSARVPYSFSETICVIGTNQDRIITP